MVDLLYDCECCDPPKMADGSLVLLLSHTSAFPWRPALDDFDVVAFAMGFDRETQACNATACD